MDPSHLSVLLAPSSGRGDFEYRPLRFSPMATALLLAFGVGGALAAVASRHYYPPWVALAPFLLTLGAATLAIPAPLRITGEGVWLPLALIARAARSRRFYPWSEVRAAVPRFYDVGFGFMSPFASSRGTLTERGIGLETADGKSWLLKFTPLRFQWVPPEGPPVERAMALLRERVPPPKGRDYSAEEIERMEREANALLISFGRVVASAFSAPVLMVGLVALLPAGALPVAALLSLAPFGHVLWLSWSRGQRRHKVLNELAVARGAPGPKS